MSTGEFIILMVLLVIKASDIFFKGYFSKKGKNTADKEDNREMSYEAEKGKNLATQEDIQEIENIKTGVSLENQRKHDFIEKRAERFSTILSHAEDLQCSANLLRTYAMGRDTRDEIHSLIQKVHEDMKAINHNARFIEVSSNDPKSLNAVTELSRIANEYGDEICKNATQVANIITALKNVMSVPNNNRDKNSIIEAEEDLFDTLSEISDNIKYEKQDMFEEKMSDYYETLHQLYIHDFHMKYDYDELP